MGVSFKFLGSLVLSLVLSAGLWAQSDSTRLHEVKPGETKYGISRQYNITIEQLERFNPEIKDGLRSGSTLLIPLPEKAADASGEEQNQGNPQDSGFISHEVKAKETLYSLSRDYGVSIAQLRENNPALEEGLKIGMILKIPVSEHAKVNALQPAQDYYLHTVAPKQTAYSLSKKYNLSLDSLYLLNPSAEEGLQIGQQLKIPKENVPLEKLDTTTQKPQELLSSDEKPWANQEPSAPEPTAKDTSQGDYILYKVKTGDSFYALKRNFNVEREDLLELNPELKEGLIVGKYIIIPKKQQAEKVSWLDKLFNKVDEPQKAPVQEDTRTLKDSLNEGISLPKPSLDTDTNLLKEVDISKNYRVALMLPFKAQQEPDTLLGRKKSRAFGPITKMSLEFYQGFLMASEALADSGMNIDLKVYDTEQSLATVKNQLFEITRNQTDLVVGPALKENVEYTAEQLKAAEIPVISPLSNAVDVRNRPNLIQVVPGVEAKDARLSEFLNEQFPHANLIFVHAGDAQALDRAKRIKSRLSPRSQGEYIENFVFSEDDFDPNNELRHIRRDSLPTVVIALSNGQVFLSELTRRLYVLKDTSLYLVGSPRLMQMETVELDYLNRLNFTTTEVLHTDYEDTLTQQFVQNYRQRFNAEPSKFALQGYDVGQYFLKTLWLSGVYFTQSLSAPGVKTTSGFKIVAQPQGGFENEFVFVTGIRNLTLVRLNQVEKEKPLEPLDR